MKITYCNNKLAKSFEDFKGLKKRIDNNLIEKIKFYYNVMLCSSTFNDFLNTGIDHPERLSNSNRRIWSLRLNANVRLIIELENFDPCLSETVKIKGVCDYHGGKNNWYIS